MGRMRIISDFLRQPALAAKFAVVALGAYTLAPVVQNIAGMLTEGELSQKNSDGISYRLFTRGTPTFLEKSRPHEKNIVDIFMFTRDKDGPKILSKAFVKSVEFGGFQYAPLSRTEAFNELKPPSAEHRETVNAACEIAEQISNIQRGWVAIPEEEIKGRANSFMFDFCR
jgi:hypothetical protein